MKCLSKIACPSCGEYLSKVINSRQLAHSDAFYRRRECLACGDRFSTHETVIPTAKPQKYLGHHNI